MYTLYSNKSNRNNKQYKAIQTIIKDDHLHMNSSFPLKISKGSYFNSKILYGVTGQG